MHVRYVSSLGMPVTDESTGEILGALSGILLDADRGTVEGFFVQMPSLLRSEYLFLSSMDILHWGKRIYVAHADILSPAEERVRLQPLLADGRTMIGQKIRTDTGKKRGVCRDIQFHTESMRLEWIFPKRLVRWLTPIPVSEVLEVRPEAIIVRDPLQPKKEPLSEKGGLLEKVVELAENVPQTSYES